MYARVPGPGNASAVAVTIDSKSSLVPLSLLSRIVEFLGRNRSALPSWLRALLVR